MQEGYVLLYRRLKEKGYYKNSQYVHLWIHLLLSANHSPREFMWNGENILIKEGQFITGRKQLSQDTGIPETTIERILKTLENGREIGQQKTSKYRLITIRKWKDYQMRTPKRTTGGQLADTNKELKELKEYTPAKAAKDMKSFNLDTGEYEDDKPSKKTKSIEAIRLAKKFDQLASKGSGFSVTTPKSYFIVLNAMKAHGLTEHGIEKLYDDWFNDEKVKDHDRVKLSYALSANNINSWKQKNS